MRQLQVLRGIAHPSTTAHEARRAPDGSYISLPARKGAEASP